MTVEKTENVAVWNRREKTVTITLTDEQWDAAERKEFKIDFVQLLLMEYTHE